MLPFLLFLLLLLLAAAAAATLTASGGTAVAAIAVGYCKILCVKHLCDVKTTDLVLHMPHVLYSNVESFLKHSCLLCAHLLWVFEFIKQIDRGYTLFSSFRFFILSLSLTRSQECIPCIVANSQHGYTSEESICSCS